MANNFTPGKNTPMPMAPIPWYKSQTMKAYLLVLGIIGVILIVLFSRQIGDLLSWLASQAALESKTIDLTFDQNNFANTDYTAQRYDPGSDTWIDDKNSVTVDNNNRLILHPQ